MKKILSLSLVVVIASLFTFTAYSQSDFKKITINNDLVLLQLTPNVYQHISYAEISGFGRVASNGMILKDGRKAFLFDTPVNDQQTQQLVEWMKDSLKLQLVGFIPNHWHIDCMGGLAYLQRIGIDSYANQMTIDLAKAKNLPVPAHGFKDSLELKLGNHVISVYYPGAGHTTDNIVVWIPAEKVLFAGCLVKELSSKGLGNTADGDLTAYPVTVDKVLQKYPDAKFVIPGHGAVGGIELIKHTKELATRK